MFILACRLHHRGSVHEIMVGIKLCGWVQISILTDLNLVEVIAISIYILSGIFKN